MRLSSARMAFLRPKARAISRVPTLPDCLPMKARMSSLEGRGGLVIGRFTKIKSASQSSLARSCRWGRRVLPEGRHLPALALRAGFFAALTGGLGCATAFGFAGGLRAVLRGLGGGFFSPPPPPGPRAD